MVALSFGSTASASGVTVTPGCTTIEVGNNTGVEVEVEIGGVPLGTVSDGTSETFIAGYDGEGFIEVAVISTLNDTVFFTDFVQEN
ncbi:MAG: hypothetical protein M3Q36_01395, partial [bacterium]|nr:hypothetical protein [bacterium]